jgi:hypothetical protein
MVHARKVRMSRVGPPKMGSDIFDNLLGELGRGRMCRRGLRRSTLRAQPPDSDEGWVPNPLGQQCTVLVSWLAGVTRSR